MDDHGDLYWKFNKIRNGDDLFEETFNLIHSRYFVIDTDYSLDNGWHFSDGLLDLRNWLSDFSLDFLEIFIIIGDYLLDLLDQLANDRFLDNIDYLLDTNFFTSNLDDLLHFLDDLDYFFYFSIDRDDLLNDPVDWHWDFDGNDGGLFDFDHFFNFDHLGNNAIDCDLLRYVYTNLNDLLLFLIDYLHNLDYLLNRHYLLHNLFNYSFNLIKNILDDFHLNNLILDDRHLNHLLYLFNLLYFHNTIDYFFNDLWHLNNLFNDPWYNNNLLNNFLNFNYLGYFHHFFNDLIDIDSNLFDTLEGAGYFNDLLDDDLDGIGLVDIVIHWFFYFDDLVDLDNLVNILGHLDDLEDLGSFHDDLGDDLWNTDDLFLVEGDFHPTIDDLLDLLINGHGLIDYLLDFFYPISIDDLLLNHFNLFDSGDFHLDLDYLLNSSGYFNNLLHNFFYWDSLFNDDFNDLR